MLTLIVNPSSAVMFFEAQLCFASPLCSKENWLVNFMIIGASCFFLGMGESVEASEHYIWCVIGFCKLFASSLFCTS